MTNALHDFIGHARKKGMDHATIRLLLLSAGWKEKDVAEAMTQETLDMAVPLPPDTGGARDAFFHLLTFAAFFTTAISLMTVAFQYISYFLPDPALEGMYGNEPFSGMRWSIAAIIVACPIFLLLSRFLVREMRQHPEKSSSAIRRWLTYITLFFAASALMGDFITLVFYLLEGELSLRFLLKVLVVLAVAGSSFVYYFQSLRIAPGNPRAAALHSRFGYGTLLVSTAAVITGIILAGSPLEERERKFDQRRLDDLRVINSEIRNIVLDRTKVNGPVLKEALPPTLPELQNRAQYQRPSIVDPETGEPYEYVVKDRTHFELCAVFNASRDEELDVFWNHSQGRACFMFDVLDERY